MEVATRPPQTSARSSGKLIEALATLGALLDRTINEVRAMERDFQNRLQQTVHETETVLHAQGVQQVEAARREVQDMLTSKFQSELQTALDALRSEFAVEREQLQSALRDAKGAAARLEAENSKLIAEVQRVREEGEAGITRVKEAGVAEMESLRHELTNRFKKESHAAAETLKAEMDAERDRLMKEVRRGNDAAARLESERTHLMEDLQQLRQEASRALEKTREEIGSKSKRETQEAIDTITREFNAERERLNTLLISEHAECERLGAECERLVDERDRLNRELRASTERASRIAAEVDELAAQIVQARADGLAGIERARDESSARHQKESQAALDALRDEFKTERDTLNRELRHAVDAAAKLEGERSGLIAEVQRVKDKAAADVEKARGEVAAATQAAAGRANAAPDRVTDVSVSVKEEIERIEARLGEALKVIDDPATELSEVIRKNVEKSELDAYLKGIRFVIGRYAAG